MVAHALLPGTWRLRRGLRLLRLGGGSGVALDRFPLAGMLMLRTVVAALVPAFAVMDVLRAAMFGLVAWLRARALRALATL